MTYLTSWSLSLRASCRSTFVIYLTLCVLALSTSAGLRGQALSGITGTVTDASGAVIPAAKITITNVNTHVVNHAETTSGGGYNLPDLLPGTYTVQAEAPGFQISIHNGVLVEVGRSSTVDLSLTTGNVRRP